jgi:hypothetical protein
LPAVHDASGGRRLDDNGSIGLTVGVNLVCKGAHCLAGLIEVQAAAGGYSAVSFGLAYRR